MHRWMITLLALAGMGFAQADGGRAKVDLLLASPTYQAGRPLHAAVRITYEDGWHGYWINPGEGGMRTGIAWKLPTGWKAGEASFPAPKLDTTGGLSCYGYTGVVVVPVTLEPPVTATGDAMIEARLTWLACNDGACVPGEAVVRATVRCGPPQETAATTLIRQARESLPAPVPGLSLEITESDTLVTLVIRGDRLPNLERAEVFPITEQALSPKKPIILTRNGADYRATADRNEYASGALRELRIVVAGGTLPRPVLAEWKWNR